eukprot:1364353-Amorphochlora_amoeboformis.AAC.1
MKAQKLKRPHWPHDSLSNSSGNLAKDHSYVPSPPCFFLLHSPSGTHKIPEYVLTIDCPASRVTTIFRDPLVLPSYLLNPLTRYPDGLEQPVWEALSLCGVVSIDRPESVVPKR